MIFESVASENADRLKKVLIADKHFNPEQISGVLKSDLYSLLLNYAEVKPSDISLDISVLEDGSYKFNFVATCNRLKIFGSLPDEY